MSTVKALRTAAQRAMGAPDATKAVGRAASSASKTTSERVGTPQLLLGHDPKFDKSYRGKNALSGQRDNNLVNYVGRGGDTVSLPAGTNRATLNNKMWWEDDPVKIVGATPLEPSLTSPGNRIIVNERGDALLPWETKMSHGEEDFRFAAQEAEETGNVVGLLRKQNELLTNKASAEKDMAIHLSRGDYTSAAHADAQARRLGRESELYNDPVTDLERNANLQRNTLAVKYTDGVNTGPGGYGPTITRDQYSEALDRKLYSGDAYDEAVHMRNNTATSTNAMNSGANGPTPPSSSNIPINPGTTPTGSTDYSGRYVPSASVDHANEISGLLRPLESDTALGLASSVGMGALLGGSANYAMGGDFTEGAMMGGLAGGAIKIGSRAIQANESGIESYLQRSVLGDSYDSSTAVNAIRAMPSAPEGAGLMQRGAFDVLKSDSASMGMQSRYATIGGSMLSGVAFTGKRNDRRRGFNAHRGNRI